MTNDGLKPGLIINCNTDTFFISKLVWSQFAYFRVLMISEEQENVHIDAHEDFLPFFKFVAGRDLLDDQILAVRDSAIDLGMDMDGRLSGQLGVRLHRWATSYAVGRECYDLFQIACNTKFVFKWPQDPFCTSISFRDAIVASVLPIDGDPAIDLRNVHLVQKIWSGERCDGRAVRVRALLAQVFENHSKSPFTKTAISHHQNDA